MKEKGIKILFSVFLFASLLMPFSVYAAEQTQIVPTWNWGSQYANQFTVTNFCEGSGTSVSCELRFTANNSYYGYLSFDGYNGNTKWIDYKNVWIADGYGAYRYSLYQNGVIQINKINIEGGFLKSSMDNLDLQDIIDLLTAIETDTTSIDNQINTELQRLQSIINNQITQNGYLEILTRIRSYNIPYESLSFNLYLMSHNNIYTFTVNPNSYFSTYPIYSLPANSNAYQVFINGNPNHPLTGRLHLIIGANQNLSSVNLIYQNFQIDSNKWKIENFKYLSYIDGGPINYLIYFEVVSNDGQNGSLVLKPLNNMNMIGILSTFDISRISTDFALQYGLTNSVLNNLNTIANGTAQSNSAASGLESSNSTMASDMNSMATIENGYSQDFNSQLQNIDFTNPIQQNQGILPAANFVISIFNGLISNNPFTVLIIIVCILLIGKKVIGK